MYSQWNKKINYIIVHYLKIFLFEDEGHFLHAPLVIRDTLLKVVHHRVSRICGKFASSNPMQEEKFCRITNNLHLFLAFGLFHS